MTNKALGKGLSALIPMKEPESFTPQGGVLEIPIASIQANKYQPRTEFNQAKLNDLINSIKEKGIVQPVLLRKTENGYELIAGERRLRAAKALGMEKIPAILKKVADVDMLEISLIENIQREELNPMEEAFAYQRLMTEFGFTQEAVSKVIGKDRSTVANTLRLLFLPNKVQDHLAKGDITTGHAKAILSLHTEGIQISVCNIVIKKGLSVRETEALAARRMLTQKPSSLKVKDGNIVDIENRLQQILGTRVIILHGKKRGRIQIDYYSNDDLDRILGIFENKRP
jgi:ParB family chromosome partitioning protein